MRSPLVLFCLLYAASGCDEGEIALLSGAAGSGGARCPDAGVPECGVGATSAAGGAAGAAGAAGGCTSSVDCRSGGEPHCDTASGRCVECLLSSHCDSNRSCDTLTLQCADACGIHADCTSGGRPFCEPQRLVCIECRSDADCSGRCLLPNGECVDCLSDADCLEPSNPRCDAADHHCVGN